VSVKSLPVAPEAGKLFRFIFFGATLENNSVLENTSDENLFEVKKIRMKF
jgi:hypothetical protein